MSSWLSSLLTSFVNHHNNQTSSASKCLPSKSSVDESHHHFDNQEDSRRILEYSSFRSRLSSRAVISTTSAMVPYSVSGLCWQYQIPLLTGLFTILWLLLKLWRSVRERQIRIIPASWNGIHAHQWSLIQCLTHRATCCVCRSLIVDAMFCDSCGVCLDFACYQNYISRFGLMLKKKPAIAVNSEDGLSTRRKSSQKPLETLGQCKSVSTSRSASTEESATVWPHQWIHGNLPAHSKCFLCGEYCDDDDLGASDHEMVDLAADHTLYHYRCCWCQRAAHEACFEKNRSKLAQKDPGCDFGKWKRYILPPGCIIHKRIWSTRARGRAIALEEIKDFRSVARDWEPLFVVANRKSGSNDAGTILSRFLTVLNPLQVIDLSQDANSLELALQICKMLPTGVQTRILVAGGDGTVGWVLNTIQKLQLDPPPAVAILPLGTGNDLARVLGWNQDTPTTHRLLDRQDLIQTIYRSERIQLDRWTVDIRPSDYYHRSRSLLLASLHIPKTVMPPGNRTVSMYNYFSVGVDALVALNFHETRKSSLYKFFFTNTLINKFIYFTYGTKDLLERRCANLHNKVHLELDGVPKELPELESIVLLNIPSWGGGIKLAIPSGEDFEQKLDDGLIEVFGLTSSFHIGQVMIGLSKPIFLGQARQVKLVLDEHLPVQVDGEPWIQSPAQIQLDWNSHATLLKNHNANTSFWVAEDGDR